MDNAVLGDSRRLRCGHGLKLKFIFNIDGGARQGRALHPPCAFRGVNLFVPAFLFNLVIAGALALAGPLVWAQSVPADPDATPTKAVISSPASTNQADRDTPAGLSESKAESDPAPPDEATEAMLPHFKDTRFWLTGQANFIFQTHPPFPALYSGTHSLSPNYEKATSRVMTIYTGVRLNSSAELLVDIEEAGGMALSQGFGLAGNTDLDIVRNPLLSKAPYLGRGMIHKVFALSKDKVENSRSAFSLFDELPRRRLEVRFGKFSMPDFFDANSVGSGYSFPVHQLDHGQQWRLGLRRRHPRIHGGIGRRL